LTGATGQANGGHATQEAASIHRAPFKQYYQSAAWRRSVS
jgi:hypothetical protein